jgi:alkylation response protein AidB-like acyl-CoA dehydrogenase
MSGREVSALVALETMLCAAEQDGAAFSAALLADQDRQEQFPRTACDLLDAFGMASYYVPRGHGGRMRSFAELLQLWRAVARRDLTVAVAHGKTFLGTACVWVVNDAEQARALGQEVSSGTIVSWGLTERHHGSDLLAGELTAEAQRDGWLVNGEKWLINNASRGQVLCVLARTTPAGGPRGFSLLLVDKRKLADHQYRCLTKEATHGIRGADISGIAYRDALVPHNSLVGTAGQGIEIVLKALQLSRTVCVSLSLGAADHALRLAINFAAQRQLYERRLLDLPLARRAIGEAAATLMVAEAVCFVTSRCITALPGEMSVLSAIAKAFVPCVVDELIASLGDLLGARAFLSEYFEHGMFQKIERDHRIVAIFDGSTVVNRTGLINQFRELGRAYIRQTCDRPGLALALDWQASLPEFEPEKLRLLSGRGCSVLQSLPQAVAEMARVQSPRSPSPMALALADALCEMAAGVAQACAEYQPVLQREVPPTAFELAQRYELCFAGAACIGFWLANQHRAGNSPGLWHNALWLEAALVRIVSRLTPVLAQLEQAVDIYDVLAEQVTADSAQPISLLTAIEGDGR